MDGTKKTPSDILKEEVATLKECLAGLGNATDYIATADLNEDNEDYRKATAWNTLLDQLYDIVADYGKDNDITED